jgi:hypothetical protein
MKNILLVAFIFSFLLQSCDYGILYDQPQPVAIKNLNEFPEKIIGKYYDDSTNVGIVIETKRIIKITTYDIAVSKAEMDTLPDCKLVGDSLYLVDLQQFIPVNQTNDSVFGKLSSPDTLFTISHFNVLRKMKKNFFLSIMHESGNWQVIKLSKLKKSGIEFSVIPQSINFDQLNNITPIDQLKDHNDSILNYKITPSREQFETLINKGFFNKSEIYYKARSGR